MSRPPRDAGDAVDRARIVIATSSNVDEVKVAQSVLLPALGLSLEQTALALGKERHWVSRVRNKFIRGEPNGTHGGRRNAYFTEGQERELVEAVMSGQEFTWRPRSEATIRKVLALRLSRETRAPVSDSMVTDVLDRYARHYVPDASWGSLENYQRAMIRLANANHEHRVQAKKQRAMEKIQKP